MPNFNGGLTKSSLKLRYGSVIMPPVYVDISTYLCCNPDGLSNAVNQRSPCPTMPDKTSYRQISNPPLTGEIECLTARIAFKFGGWLGNNTTNTPGKCTWDLENLRHRSREWLHIFSRKINKRVIRFKLGSWFVISRHNLGNVTWIYDYKCVCVCRKPRVLIYSESEKNGEGRRLSSSLWFSQFHFDASHKDA